MKQTADVLVPQRLEEVVHVGEMVPQMRPYGPCFSTEGDCSSTASFMRMWRSWLCPHFPLSLCHTRNWLDDTRGEATTKDVNVDQKRRIMD